MPTPARHGRLVLLALTLALLLPAAAPTPGPSPGPAPAASSPGPSPGPSQDPPTQPTADELWADGRREDAIALQTQGLEAEPGNVDLRRSLALRELAVHRYQGALATASEAPQALAWIRAECLFQLGRYEEALPLLDPTDPFQALLHLEALERLGRTDEARAALPQVAELIGADDPRLLGVLGRLDAGDGAHAAAARSFEAVLAQDPYDLGALFGLGQAKLRSGAREEGLELLERHRGLVPLMDQWDFAQRAVDLAPLHAANHAQLGDVERALGRLDRAREAYMRAARLSEDRALAPVVLRLARLLEEDLADPDAAVAALDAGAAQSGDLRIIVRAGDVLMRAGRADEAAARFQAALARRPGDPALEARLAQATASTRATSTGAATPDDGDGR